MTARALARAAVALNPASAIPAAPAAPPVDIEVLVQWAVAQSIAPRLWVPSARELKLNPYDVFVRGADNRFYGNGVLVEGGRRAGDIDADRVLRAIDGLDPWARSIVLVNGRAGRRPDWMEGVVPRLVSARRRCKRKHRRVAKIGYWEPCSPAAIRAAREVYLRWHAALRLLARRLDGRLVTWQINGFAAPAAPWEEAGEKSA